MHTQRLSSVQKRRIGRASVPNRRSIRGGMHKRRASVPNRRANRFSVQKRRANRAIHLGKSHNRQPQLTISQF